MMLFLGFLGILCFSSPALSFPPQSQVVPMRIDLGVERCETRCRRTPYLGENIDITIHLIDDWPETWKGDWQSEVSYDGQTYSGRVELLVTATPNGYVFQVTSEVAGSSHVDWLPNLSVLRINETRAPKRSIGNKTHLPYIITGPKFN